MDTAGLNVGRDGSISYGNTLVADRVRGSVMWERLETKIRERTPLERWERVAAIVEPIDSTPGPLGRGIDYYLSDGGWGVDVLFSFEWRSALSDELFAEVSDLICAAIREYAIRLRPALAAVAAFNTEPPR